MTDRHNLAFGKKNYILIAVGMAIVIIGFLLMITPPSTEIYTSRKAYSVYAP